LADSHHLNYIVSTINVFQVKINSPPNKYLYNYSGDHGI